MPGPDSPAFEPCLLPLGCSWVQPYFSSLRNWLRRKELVSLGLNFGRFPNTNIRSSVEPVKTKKENVYWMTFFFQLRFSSVSCEEKKHTSSVPQKYHLTICTYLAEMLISYRKNIIHWMLVDMLPFTPYNQLIKCYSVLSAVTDIGNLQIVVLWKAKKSKRLGF